MKYPEGNTIHTGDLIWFNEGVQIGRVSEVLEEEADLQNYGLGEPGIMICFDVLEAPLTADLFYAQNQLSDEGVGPLSDDERKTLESLHSRLQNEMQEIQRYRRLGISVNFRLAGNGALEDRWEFRYAFQDEQAQRVFVFEPGRLSYREIVEQI